MGRPILAAYDPQHSDHAPIRVAAAAAAARFTGARLVIASVHVGVRAPALSAGQTLPYALAEADDKLVPDASDELREIRAEEGHEAVRGAYALARRTGARLRVLTVVKPRVVMYTETEATMPPLPGRDFDRVVWISPLGLHNARYRALKRRLERGTRHNGRQCHSERRAARSRAPPGAGRLRCAS
jgi:nucleotide-binding universal stress UspA family protein